MICDHGPGVAESERDEMFRPFKRFGDRTETGVGLGMAVARGMIEAVGGAIRLDDTPGGGLTVSILMKAAT